MPALTYRNDVFIAVLAAYIPALALAILLAVRHGFGRADGWRFLIIFALVRILSAGFQLGTIASPTNDSLYAGYVALVNIALSPLEGCTLGLLARVLENINLSHKMRLTARHIRLVQLLVTIGLVLGIVGGTFTEESWGSTGVFKPSTLSQVSVGLFIAAFVIIVIVTISLSRCMAYAGASEKRLLIAVGASLPFLLVRIVYSAISTFKYSTAFNSLEGNVTYLLSLVLITEFVVVVLYEGVGTTLVKAPKRLGSETSEEAGVDSMYVGAQK